MKLEARSKHLLSITKSKAKMYEFSIPEADHIELRQNPNKLLIATLGILGDLAAMEARQDTIDDEVYQEFRTEMASVGQYFDALIQSHLADDVIVYLKLVGASAYYLADMPGSSTVLSNGLPSNPDALTASYIEGLLVWLLKSDYNEQWYRIEESYLTELIDSLGTSCREFFNLQSDSSQLVLVAHTLRRTVYQSGTDRELLLVDVILAVLFRKIKNSSINCLPRYTSLPLSDWLSVLSKPSFIKEFWPAQKLLGEQGILAGASAVVQMPTSAGKTKSTELIIRSAFISGRADVAVIVAPFRALCREITSTLQNAFQDEDVNINELQDVMSVSDEDLALIALLTGTSVEQQLSRKSIIISTPEKLVYLLRHEPELAANIGLLIFDEGHQFDTGKRGVTYELLMATLKASVNDNVQKVLISAVMANANSIGEWLNGESGVEIQGNKCLPTVRSVAFASWKTNLGQLHYIDQERADDRDFFVPRVIEQINLGKRGREKKDRLFPSRNDNSSLAAYFGVRLCHQGPVAIFCGVKSTIATICSLLVDCHSRGLSLPLPLASSDQAELDKISYLSSLHFGGDYIFTRSIKLGILPHSSNIPNGMRVSVEWAMESNKAVLVVCTSTLAQGVNLPIKYLVVSSTFQAGKEISTRDFHNLIGRAGRSGHHTEGSIIFADTDIYDQRLNPRNWKWQRALHLLDFRNAEDCVSSLMDLIRPFEFPSILTDVIQFIVDPEHYRSACVTAANQNAIDIAPLLFEMDYKEQLINTVESYFLSYLKDNPDAEDMFFDDLAQGTLAYYLSNDTEKQLLRDAFSHIADRVMNVPNNKYSFYGKALLGLNQLQKIEAWLDEHWLGIEATDSQEDILRLCWPLIIQMSGNKVFEKVEPENVRLDFGRLWISGKSYQELLSFLEQSGATYRAGSQRRAIKMDHVIGLADGALSFDSMLVMGAIADIAEGKGMEESVLESIRILQSRLKIGLSSNLEVWLYSKGYVDREVCKIIASSLQSVGVSLNDFDYQVLETHSQVVERCLITLPTYFSDNQR
jgi:POLQ-like helicase